MKSFDHKQLLRLAGEQEASLPLRMFWQKRTGTDPVLISETVVRYNRIKSWLTFGLLGVAVVFCIIGLFATNPGGDEFMVQLNRGSFIGALLTMLVGVVFSIVYKDGDDRFSWDEKSFPFHFSILLEISGLTPHDVAVLNPNDLQRLARRLLIECARKMLHFENQHRVDFVPSEHYREEKAKLARMFERAHASLLQLGLVGKDYGPYYRDAATGPAA